MSEHETGLKSNSVSKFDVIVMGISAAAPVMCLAASMGDIMNSAGTATPLAFILATIVLVMVGVSFGQLSARYNSAGGAYAYVRSVFGEKIGFVTAWLNVGTMICTGVIGAVFSTYLNDLFPAIPLWLGILMLFVPVFLIGWRGVELSTKALIVVWAVQMVLIIYPAIRIWTMPDHAIADILANSVQAFQPTFGISGLMLGVLICVWCYVGFESPAYMGEELKGGSRSVKTAITASAIGIGVIYAATCWLWVATMTKEQFNAVLSSGTLLVDYCRLIGYASGGTLISIACLVSCVGCFISFATAAPRCFYDMGRNTYLPQSVSKVNRHQSPYVSLILYSAVWIAAALYGSYGNMSNLFTFMSLFASATYIMVCAANIKDRIHEKGLASLLLNKVLPVVSIAILVYMIVSSDALSLGLAGVWLCGCIAAAWIWARGK